MNYFVYILFSELTGRYYVGQTNDLQARITRHNAGLVSSTAKGRPWKIVWFTEKPNRSEAVILERKLKNINASRKKEFIEKYPIVPFQA